MSDEDYRRKRSVERMRSEMQVIERDRRRARECDMLFARVSGSLRKVEMRVGARIVAWFTPASKGEWKEMQLTDEEVDHLKDWLRERSGKLREHADLLESKWAGVGSE